MYVFIIKPSFATSKTIRLKGCKIAWFLPLRSAELLVQKPFSPNVTSSFVDGFFLVQSDVKKNFSIFSLSYDSDECVNYGLLIHCNWLNFSKIMGIETIANFNSFVSVSYS